MDWLQWFHGWIVIAALVSVIASQKGRPGPLWLGYALVMLPIALIHALTIEPGSSR